MLIFDCNHQDQDSDDMSSSFPHIGNIARLFIDRLLFMTSKFQKYIIFLIGCL